MASYLDTSAFMKLVRSEPESPALRAHMAPGRELVSSALLIVEARRAAARYGPSAQARAQQALGTITLLPIDDPTLELACTMHPRQLRSLDALHLAAASSIGDDLGSFYCYDERLCLAARAMGLDVQHPA